MHEGSGSHDSTIAHASHTPRPLPRSPSLQPPDKYELLECLGRGGCGVVHKARDRSLDRLVAIKFLLDARAADLERFRREARIAARLSHPAIVQVYEFNDAADQPYIAMQYLEGGSLAAAKLDIRGIVQAMRTIAGALARAHDAGIVHRDVKPANILLDAQGRALLGDFGLARDLDHASGITMSRDGALVGTPALMAPEQARGDLRAIDARCDVYALGATLFTLLCGRYPFESTSLVELLHAVIHTPVPPPRTIQPSIPEPLERIILKCMQKEPAWRYAGMQAVIADLDAFLADRMPAGAAAVPSSSGLAARIQRRAEQARADLYSTIGVQAIRQLAAWDAHLYRVGSNVARLYPQLDSVISSLDEVLQSQPHCAWARFYRGAALIRRGRLDDGIDDMERSLDRMAGQADAQFEAGRAYLALFLREQRRAHKHLSKVGTRYHLSGVRGRLHQAAVCFHEAQRLRHDLLDWQLDFTDAVALLADGDYEGCVARCDRILERDADLDDVWRLRGDALRFSGHDPIDSYDQAIRIRRSAYEAHLGKAEAYLSCGRLADARECLRTVLEIMPECIEAQTRLARCCLLELRTMQPDSANGCWRTLLEEGLRVSEDVIRQIPASYDAAITKAELLLESARLGPDSETLSSALATLESATKLDGCQNRVGFLTARALLHRARIRKNRGESAADDLAKVLAYADGPATKVPDNEAWLALLDDARRISDPPHG